MSHRSVLLAAAITALVAASANSRAETLTFDLKVKTANTSAIANLEQTSDVVPGTWSCPKSFVPGPAVDIGGADPGHPTSTPADIQCPSVGPNGRLLLPIRFYFASLRDIGTWTFTCDGEFGTCVSDPNGPCNISCYNSYPASETSTFVIHVFDHPPAANPTFLPTPDLYGNGSSFHANSSDPDHDSLTHVWTMTTFPPKGASSIIPPSWYGSSANPPVVQFNNDMFIGDWVMTLQVIDEPGQRITKEIPFTIPNWPPTLDVPATTTVNAGETIEIAANASDPDDHPDQNTPPMVTWDILSSPALSTHQPKTGAFTGATLSVVTTDKDIGTFQLNVNATDNDASANSTVTKPAQIIVNNVPPTIDVTGREVIKVGDELQLTATASDPDGGPTTVMWDIVQVPHSAAALGYPLQKGFSHDTAISIPVHDVGYAGTWIFRASATDNDHADNSTTDTYFTVLVDGMPTATIDVSTAHDHLSGDDLVVDAGEFPLTLDAGKSLDPDSPCPTDPMHCHDSDGSRPLDVSDGIKTYEWFLDDVSPELGIQTGRVDETMGTSGSDSKVVFNSSQLPDGRYTFRVKVIDAEGNPDEIQQTIDVIAPNTAPTVILNSPTARGLDTPTGGLDIDLTLDLSESFDEDNELAGQTLGPGIGIKDYHWTVQPPAGCTPPSSVPLESTATFTLYKAGDHVPVECHGVWTVIGSVGDDDTPQLHAQASALVVIGTCGTTVCIDSPTQDAFAEMPFADDPNVQVDIFYYVDSSVYDAPSFIAGSYTQLQIRKTGETASFYTFTDPNRYSDKGNLLRFQWNGFGSDLSRPTSGTYDVTVTLLDSNFAATQYSATQLEAIHIAVAQVNVLPTSDRFISRDDLVAGTRGFRFKYEVTGGATVDSLVWHVVDSSNTEIIHGEVPFAESGTIPWDGKIGPDVVATGAYTFTLEARRGASSLGTSPGLPIGVYRLAFTPASGSFPTTGLPIFVNDDDDDWNGQSDKQDQPASPQENDLVQVALALESAGDGNLTLSTTVPVALKVWADPNKNTEIVLPKTYQIPTDTVPGQIFLEGAAAATSQLQATLVGTATPQFQATLPLRLVQLELLGTDVATPIYATHIAAWDIAYAPVPSPIPQCAPAPAVLNAADPAHNFVDLDASRFYLRVIDPTANLDPATVDTVHVTLSTLDGSGAVNDQAVDELLTESSANSGIFVSHSQLLTTNDLTLLNPDDKFQAHDGITGPVSDNAPNDRTHRADASGSVVASYSMAGITAPFSIGLPVCARNPEERRTLHVKAFVFNEPWEDTGFPGCVPTVGSDCSGNGHFDFIDTDGDGRHTTGEPCERFIDLSAGAAPNAFATTGTYGPLAPDSVVQNEVARANLAWQQDCINVVLDSVTNIDANLGPGQTDLFADNTLNTDDEVAILNRYVPDIVPPQFLYVFFVAHSIEGIGGRAYSRYPLHAANNPAAKFNSIVFQAFDMSLNNRTLAHEIGHCLSNTDEISTNNPPPIFFPATCKFTDDNVNTYRRILPIIRTQARLLRTQNATNPGNTMLVTP